MYELRPIIFNTLMTQAVMHDVKTQTRRVVKFPKVLDTNLPDGNLSIELLGPKLCFDKENIEYFEFLCKPEFYIDMKSPYLKGDILYIRETWNYGFIEHSDEELSTESWFEPLKYDDSNIGDYLKSLSTFVYRADAKDWYDEVLMTWKPSIHMPKAAARTFLKVNSVRVERLQDITDEDAKAEGSNFDPSRPGFNIGVQEKMKQGPVDRFKKIWNSTTQNPMYSWEANPWVWVVDFEKTKRPLITV